MVFRQIKQAGQRPACFICACRSVACHYLVISFGEMDDETRRKLDEFFRDPSNAALVDRISAY